jgi:hypothetical protein
MEVTRIRFGTDLHTLMPLADIANHKTSLLPYLPHPPHNLAVVDTDAFKDFATQNAWIDWKTHVLRFVTSTLGEGTANKLKGLLPFVKTPSDAIDMACRIGLGPTPLDIEKITLWGGIYNPGNWINPAFTICKGFKYGFKAYLQAHGVPWWISEVPIESGVG